MEFLLYLAGPIHGLSYAGANDWRRYVASRLPPHIIPVSPMRSKEFLNGVEELDAQQHAQRYAHPIATPRGITVRDFFDVERCHMILINLIGAKKVTIGTMQEMGAAHILRKPMVVAMEEGNIHDHKMVRELAGFQVVTLDEAIDIVITVLSPGV